MEGEDTNPFGTGVDNPGMDDGEETELAPLTSSRRGSKDVGHPSMTSTSHPGTYGETSFIEGVDEHTPLIQRESSMDEATNRILKSYPNADTSSFFSRMDGYDQVMVRLKRSNGKWNPFHDANGGVNKKLPKTILDSLGPPAEKVVEAKEEKLAKITTKLEELRTKRETVDENQIEGIDHQINELESEKVEVKREKEATEQNMRLRDRIKAIFKKYGFTLIGVLTAVGTVIGVIVSNLKQGLTTLGKGVGNALKSIGKKLGEILPGLVGAIASFVFKTAGEVIGFLGKNAWLLIVGVVVFLIERLKKTTR